MEGIYFKDRIMAQELEQILDLLREIRRAGSTNEESLNRLLSSMNSKIDTIDRNSISADLIKSYLQDISKSMDSKYKTTSDRFTDIEKALKSIFQGQDEKARTQDLRELFDVFSQNLNNFYMETRQQKAVITSIDAKLSEFNSGKGDKDEIVRMISLIRNDFENLNQTYRASIDTLTSDLKNVLSNLISLDQSAANAQIQTQIDEMYKAVSEVIKFLQSIDKREAELEMILQGAASAESLKITQIAVDSIISKTDEISGKLEDLYDANASKEQFVSLADKVDELSENTDEVKQALVGITKNLDSLSDISELEQSLQNVYNKIKEIHEDLLATHVKGDVRELDTQINTFASELATAKKIIIDISEAITGKLLKAVEEISFENESYEIKNDVSKMLAMLPQKDDVVRLLENDELNKEAVQSLINKVDDVADMIDSLPKRTDMEEWNSNQHDLVENLQGVASKDDIDALSGKADDIEEMIDKLNFDDEFQNIYNKTASIEKWLQDSNVKENSEKILSKVEDKAEQKEVLSILKTTEEIVNNIEELSKNVDVKKVNRTVSEVYQLIEDLKNDFINTAEMHNDSVIVHLSELQKSIEYVVTGEEFEVFVQDLKNFVDKVGEDINNSSTNFDEIYNYQKSILNKISEINVSAIEEAIAKQVSPIEEKLTSLSDYIENMKVVDPGVVKSEISEIKEILANKKSNVSEIEALRKDTISTIESYLQEIKVLLDTSDSSADEDLKFKVSGIEEIINGYHAESENNLSNIILKLDDIRYLIDSTQENRKKDMRAAISDIKEVSESLHGLIPAFGNAAAPADGSVSGFMSENLSDIKSSLDLLTSEFESNIQSGFSYNAELLEEKTSVLLDFIKDIKLGNEGSSDMYERLAIADDKLSDIQQTLQWINSDVINHANNQSEMILKELVPLRDMMTGLSESIKNRKDNELKTIFDELHADIAAELEEVTRYSKSTYEKLEDQYAQVHDALSSTENNLRDFFLGDIDSVIIKLDNLKDDFEAAMGNVSLPDAKQMKEFKTFLKSIEDFRQVQEEIVANAAKDIKDTITEQFATQKEEIKSILSVAVNNAEIIDAINKLQDTFKSKINDFEKNEDAIFDDIDSAEVSEDANKGLINELKSDFEKCSELIKDLSDDNPELSEILSAIESKMNTISVSVVKAPKDISDNDIDSAELPEVDIDLDTIKSVEFDKTLVGSDNFDFIKAFDLLKEDISKLNDNVLKIVPQGLVSVQTDGKAKKTSAEPDGSMLSVLNSKMDDLISSIQPQTWLNEIKSYALGGDINRLLAEINGKMDKLMSSDNSDIVDELKKIIGQVSDNAQDVSSNSAIGNMLTAINSKIDALSAANDSSVMSEIKDAIGNISASEDKESSKLLNAINSKIDVIASVDNADDFDDIRDSLDSIEDKITDSFDISNIQDKLEIIEEKLSERSDINEIHNKLSALENKLSEGLDTDDIYRKLDQISEKNDISEIHEKLSALEDKISEGIDTEEIYNKLDKFSEDIGVSDIHTKLDSLEAKVDVLAMSDTTADIDDIKYTLFDVDEKMDLVSKLSDSDSTITSMLESLSDKVDELIQPSDNNTNVQSLNEIKELIVSQSEYIEKLEKSDKTEAYKKCLEEISKDFDKISKSSDITSVQNTLKEVKESIMAALVNVFDQVSFAEETEDIKDFVEEKTDEINKNLALVTNQLKQITNSSDEPDYTYSMQDIESDLAKMRIALNELQVNDKENHATRLTSILENITKLSDSVDVLQNSITDAENNGLAAQFDSINADIRTLGDITNQLLERSNIAFDDIGKSVSVKMDKVTRLLEKSNASDKVMRQALIYMGEWIDSASVSIDMISANSSEIVDVKSAISDLKQSLPEQTDLLNSLGEKFDRQQERLEYLEKNIDKLSLVESHFSEQQKRIDRLESALEKILSAVEDIDDSKVTRKIEKLDKQLAKLSTNVEKLASYVD